MRNGNGGRYGQMAGALAGQHLRHRNPEFFGAKGGFNRSAYQAAMNQPTPMAVGTSPQIFGAHPSSYQPLQANPNLPPASPPEEPRLTPSQGFYVPPDQAEREALRQHSLANPRAVDVASISNRFDPSKGIPSRIPDLSIPGGEIPSPTPAPPVAPPPSLIGDTLPPPSTTPGGVQNQRHYQHRLARQTGLGMDQVRNQFGQGGSWRHAIARNNPGMTAQQAGQMFNRYGGKR